MSANFTFYIHHHGSGHLMRALAIASHLNDARVTFLGSGLADFRNIIPKNINCVHLPVDIAAPNDLFASIGSLSFLHYVPINVENVAKRAGVITTTLHALFHTVLIVDVSVEVTVLATLCGTPTVVIRQNGDRDDIPHLHAYECAQLLIAPSPELLMNPSPHAWVNRKTFFSGGFSKYSGQKQPDTAGASPVGMMVGSGGTSFNEHIVRSLAAQCPDRLFHVIGDIKMAGTLTGSNIIFHGQLDDPGPVLSECRVVIGNAGHNTVMEMADLDKKFICIPEDRPFKEQLRKAVLLEKNGMAIVVMPEDLAHTDWQERILEAENLPESCWNGVISETALPDIAMQLHHVWDRNFQAG